MLDPSKVTATELREFYAAGSVTPVTVAQQVLDRIQSLNPTLNAFCFTDPDTTIAQAQASAERWRQGQPLSAIDGVPVAVKDSILTKGWPTLHASLAVDQNQSWSVDAPVVARLRAAGAVFVGKTTMSEFGSSDHDSDSLIYGKVKNPWNEHASPGGSSGGSAVAVASHMCALALASDCGGSVVVPSAWCGIVGYKPSNGLIDHVPVDVLNMSTPGLMARSVQDVSTTMKFISNTSAVETQNIFDTKHIGLIDTDQLQNFDAVTPWLLSQGCSVSPVSLPLSRAIDTFGKLMQPSIVHQWQSIPTALQKTIGKQFQKKALYAHVQEQTYASMIARQALIEYMQGLMQTFDYILVPSTKYKAVSFDHNELVSPWSAFCSVTKQPSVTIPIGSDDQNMPVGLMIIGKYLGDLPLLSMSQALSDHFANNSSPVIQK